MKNVAPPLPRTPLTICLPSFPPDRGGPSDISPVHAGVARADRSENPGGGGEEEGTREETTGGRGKETKEGQGIQPYSVSPLGKQNNYLVDHSKSYELGGFVECFLRVPHLYCSFPAAQASKGNSQKIVYKTPYPSNNFLNATPQGT